MTSTPKNRFPLFPVILLSLFIIALGVGCGGGGGGGTPPPPSTYSVGGSITGLSNTGLVLQNNAGDDLNVYATSTFTFATQQNANTAYAVSILTQPVGQTCSLSNESGTVTNANISDVVINCTLTNNDASGLYTGTTGAATVGFANVDSGADFDLDFIRGMIYDNRFIFFNVDPKANVAADPGNGIVENQNENVLIDGQITDITGTAITATASIYQAGRIVANNITVTGTVTSRINISLNLAATVAVGGAPAGNFNGGILNATFSTEFDRGASIARLETPRNLSNGAADVYMVIPDVSSSQFTIGSLNPNIVYRFFFDNPSNTQSCANTGAITNDPPADVPLIIPSTVLNVYLMADDLVPLIDCTVVTPRKGFTGFGALLGLSGSTTMWYATTNGSFSVYMESNTTP